MIMKVSSIIVSLLAITFSSLLFAADMESNRIFRLTYGASRESQPGVTWAWSNGDNPDNLGPRGIAVDNAGNVYIGDVVNGKIKKYSAKGELLACSEGNIKNISSFCIGKDNCIYVSSSLTGSCISKINSDENIEWSFSFNQIIPNDDLDKMKKEKNCEFLPRFGNITYGENLGLIIEIEGLDNKTRERVRIGVKVSDSGAFKQFIPAFGVVSYDILWGYHIARNALTGPPSSVDIFNYSPEGQLAKSIKIDIAKDADNYKGVIAGGRILPDNKGGFYVVCLGELDKPIDVTPNRKIKSAIVLNHYDGEGKHLNQIRFPSSPFQSTMYDSFTISPGGKLYYLRFDKLGVDVMVG